MAGDFVRPAHNLKLTDCVFLDSSIYYLQTAVDQGSPKAGKVKLQLRGNSCRARFTPKDAEGPWMDDRPKGVNPEDQSPPPPGGAEKLQPSQPPGLRTSRKGPAHAGVRTHTEAGAGPVAQAWRLQTEAFCLGGAGGHPPVFLPKLIFFVPERYLYPGELFP